MLNKIILTAAMLLSLVTAPAFGDDQNADCDKATADQSACAKSADTQTSVITGQVFSDSDSQQCQ